MPRAGSWMNEFNFVGGISDFAWGWGGIIGRSTTLSVWVCLSLLAAVYLAGFIRLSGDAKISRYGVGRLLMIALFVVTAVYLFMGLMGYQNLALVESFFPGDAAPV